MWLHTALFTIFDDRENNTKTEMFQEKLKHSFVRSQWISAVEASGTD